MDRYLGKNEQVNFSLRTEADQAAERQRLQSAETPASLESEGYFADPVPTGPDGTYTAKDLAQSEVVQKTLEVFGGKIVDIRL